jgi:precorrin-6B methylase 2
MQRSGFVSWVKTLILPAGTKVRVVRGGLLRGLNFPIDFASQAQIYFGTLERENHDWVRRMSADARTFVDVGAGHGLFTLYALAKTQAERVMAFEPNNALREAIKRALEANGLSTESRVEIHPFTINAGGVEGTRALDALLGGASEPMFLKVDVEGSELEVLEGAKGTLASKDVRCVVETHAVDLERECSALLGSLGYHVEIIDNAWWRRTIPEMRPIKHNRWLAAYRAFTAGAEGSVA